MKSCVIIPGFNEQKHIGSVVAGAKKYVKTVIFIDDGSADKSAALAEKNGAIVLKHIVNLGKGAALKTGCDYAIKNGFEQLVVMDADAQHKPEDIPHFLKALQNTSMVYGHRTLDKKMPGILQFGNRVINKTITFLYGVSIIDSQCGFRAFTASTYKKIRWNAVDYSMESEMIARAGKQNIRYTQLPIETIYNDRHKGTTVIDGVKIMMNLFLWKLVRN